jgi:1-acyl-sn-glycerol-3-phosphate acyltransferase
MRRLLTAFFRFVVRVFYRHVEVAGVDNVPARDPVLFAVNHPNGLIDPLFLLCFAPRQVSFLAKAPLFTMPVIGWFAKKLDSIPVYRKGDNVAGSNRETFAKARALLQRGGSIAIFPEGTTHSDPRLRELKTGAARIALGCGCPTMFVVPTGIYYTQKETFRSAAMIVFGAPIDVGRALGPSEDEPDPESVHTLTGQIERALDDVTLQADSHAALDLIAHAERIFTGGTRDLATEFELRRRFVQGYAYLRERDPQRLERLTAEVAQIDAEEIAARKPRAAALWRLLLLPFAIAGAIVNYPTYRLVGLLAVRFARGEDEMVATIKALAAMLLFPLTWIALAIIFHQPLLVLLLPLLGWIALRVFETVDQVIGRARAFFHRDAAAEREKLRAEIMAVADEMDH